MTDRHSLPNFPITFIQLLTDLQFEDSRTVNS